MNMPRFVAEASLYKSVVHYDNLRFHGDARGTVSPSRTGLTLTPVHKPAASLDGSEHQAVAVCQKPAVQPKHANVSVEVASGLEGGYLALSNGIHSNAADRGPRTLVLTFDSAR
jgi:hypothetical protein